MLGAFDDLNTIADVCKQHGLWLHADACLGGSAIFSTKHRHLLSGDFSNQFSFTVCSRKRFFFPPFQASNASTQCRGILTRRWESRSSALFFLLIKSDFFTSAIHHRQITFFNKINSTIHHTTREINRCRVAEKSMPLSSGLCGSDEECWDLSGSSTMPLSGRNI